MLCGRVALGRMVRYREVGCDVACDERAVAYETEPRTGDSERGLEDDLVARHGAEIRCIEASPSSPPDGVHEVVRARLEPLARLLPKRDTRDRRSFVGLGFPFHDHRPTRLNDRVDATQSAPPPETL